MSYSLYPTHSYGGPSSQHTMTRNSSTSSLMNPSHPRPPPPPQPQSYYPSVAPTPMSYPPSLSGKNPSGPPQDWTHYASSSSSSAQWGMWPGSQRGVDGSSSGMISLPSTSAVSDMLPLGEQVGLGGSSGIGKGDASNGNGMLNYGSMSMSMGNGDGKSDKLEIFDTYEAPGINLETGDRFSQLLEAKLNLMNQAQAHAVMYQQQSRQQEQHYPSQFSCSSLNPFPILNDNRTSLLPSLPQPPAPADDATSVSLAPAIQSPLAPPQSVGNVPAPGIYLQQHQQQHQHQYQQQHQQQHQQQQQPQQQQSITYAPMHSQSQQDVSLIPGLQPSPWTWQSIVTSEYGPSVMQPLSAIVQRSSPPLQHTQQPQPQNANIDPSAVDALLRDWSQTQIQPDLVAPLPLEVASRPSSSGLSNGTSSYPSQTAKGDIQYATLPYSGILPRLPVTYPSQSPPRGGAPSSSYQSHTFNLPYSLPPAQPSSSPHMINRPPPQPYQHALSNSTSQPPYASQPRQHSGLASGSTPNSIHTSRSHSLANSPIVPTACLATQMPLQPIYNAQGWLQQPPSLQQRPQHQQGTPISNHSSALPVQQRTPPESLPPLLKIRVQTNDSGSRAGPSTRVSPANTSALSPLGGNAAPGSSATPWLSAPYGRPHNQVEWPHQQWQSQVEGPPASAVAEMPLQANATTSPSTVPRAAQTQTKKFSLSTSVKGSALKSMSKGKGETRGRKKKENMREPEVIAEVSSTRSDSVQAEAFAKGRASADDESMNKESRKKKRKISTEKGDRSTLSSEVFEKAPLPVSAPAAVSAPLTILAIPSKDKEREKKLMDKTSIACHACRSKKLKCNGDRPKCYHCVRRGEDSCSYEAILRRRGPGKQNKRKSEMGDGEGEGDGGGNDSDVVSKKARRGRRSANGGSAEHEHGLHGSVSGSGSAFGSGSASTSDEEYERKGEDQDGKGQHGRSRSMTRSPTTSRTNINARTVGSAMTTTMHIARSSESEMVEDEPARQARTPMRIGEEDLRGMSCVLNDVRGAGGGEGSLPAIGKGGNASSGVGAGAVGGVCGVGSVPLPMPVSLGMGFGGPSGRWTSSGSRFELSTARE